MLSPSLHLGAISRLWGNGCICLPNSLLGTHQVPSVLQGRGGKSSLWGAWHWDGALWHDPMPYKGEGGRRLPLRRHPQSLCSIPGQCSQMGRLVGPEPPPPISVTGSTRHRCIPPTLG